MTSSLLLPVIFILAMLPANVFDSYTWSLTLGSTAMLILAVYLCLLWVMYAIRRPRKGGVQR
ncbi:hypothetical protein D3C75_1305920 [compost metagenome]